MQNLGKNMAYILKSIKKADLHKPEYEESIKTNFIR